MKYKTVIINGKKIRISSRCPNHKKKKCKVDKCTNLGCYRRKCPVCGNKTYLPTCRKHLGRTKNIWKKMKRNRKKKCEECTSTKNLTIHHIDFNRYNNNIDNFQTLCESCHNNKHEI